MIARFFNTPAPSAVFQLFLMSPGFRISSYFNIFCLVLGTIPTALVFMFHILLCLSFRFYLSRFSLSVHPMFCKKSVVNIFLKSFLLKPLVFSPRLSDPFEPPWDFMSFILEDRLCFIYIRMADIIKSLSFAEFPMDHPSYQILSSSASFLA